MVGGVVVPGCVVPFGEFDVVPGSRWLDGFASTLLRCGSTGVLATPGAGLPGDMPGTFDEGDAVAPGVVAADGAGAAAGAPLLDLEAPPPVVPPPPADPPPPVWQMAPPDPMMRQQTVASVRSMGLFLPIEQRAA